MKNKGFTLIELLIVIAVIAILAGVVFVSLDPLSRFRDARDAARITDVTAILSAIKVDQVDNRGSYLTSITSAFASTTYQISGDTTNTNCNTNCSYATSTSACVNLSGLITEGYLGRVPVNPNGSGTWTTSRTGYYLMKNTNGSVTVGSCDAESVTPIEVTR